MTSNVSKTFLLRTASGSWSLKYLCHASRYDTPLNIVVVVSYEALHSMSLSCACLAIGQYCGVISVNLQCGSNHVEAFLPLQNTAYCLPSCSFIHFWLSGALIIPRQTCYDFNLTGLLVRMPRDARLAFLRLHGIEYKDVIRQDLMMMMMSIAVIDAPRGPVVLRGRRVATGDRYSTDNLSSLCGCSL